LQRAAPVAPKISWRWELGGAGQGEAPLGVCWRRIWDNGAGHGSAAMFGGMLGIWHNAGKTNSVFAPVAASKMACLAALQACRMSLKLLDASAHGRGKAKKDAFF
jgi:hypothetical protein